VGLGFVILAILLYVLPQTLIMVFPSLFYGESAVPHLVEGSFALIFAEFAIVPSSRAGLQSFIQYALENGVLDLRSVEN
jgi:hypothetical protein